MGWRGWGFERELGVSPGRGLLDRAGGYWGRPGKRRTGEGWVPSMGAGLGKPHPKGLAVCSGQQQ